MTTVAHGFVDGEDRSPHAHYLNHSWYSITPPGGFVRSHTHSNRNFVSGVYYPHAPADSGALIFQERDNRRVVQEEQELNISSDHLYLFPGSLAHRTSPNLGDGDKTAISFDYMLLRPDKDLPPGDLVARAWEDIEQQSSILELGLKTLSSEDENP
ncbi:MAG: putative 2OG-Fe(II) oxygenase [Planctomycetota bacterium]